MAILTPLPRPDAIRLGERYGLSVRDVRGILAGSVNSNFALELEEGGQVFCRVYEEQGTATASREAALLAHLANHGVPTPEPLRVRNSPGASSSPDFIAEHAGKPVALFPWREGQMRCQASVDAPSVAAVGAALATVHDVGYDQPLWPSRFGQHELRRRIDALSQQALLEPARQAVHSATRWLDEHEHQLEPPEAQDAAGWGLTHGDLFRDNVLWNGDEISALLDFESASRGSFAFDIMVCALSWCFGDDLDTGLLRALFEGYQSKRDLGPAERSALFTQGSFAAVRFTITRLTDFELRPEGQGVYKDYRRFVARQQALDALGPAGLLREAGLSD